MTLSCTKLINRGVLSSLSTSNYLFLFKYLFEILLRLTRSCKNHIELCVAPTQPFQMRTFYLPIAHCQSLGPAIDTILI